MSNAAHWTLLIFAVGILGLGVAIGVGKWLAWHDARREAKRWWWV